MAGRVVIVGGGMAGATCSKYLRLWSNKTLDVTLIERDPVYTSNIMSSLVLTNQMQLSSLQFKYDSLVSTYGVKRVQGEVVNIDPVGQAVTLQDGTVIQYDKLIVAPGVEFDVIPGLETATNVFHAWKAGPQTTALKNQLAALNPGENVIMTIPAAPYRCPPGPYERACLLSDWLQHYKPGSKLFVLDANPNIMAERITFEKMFTQRYPAVTTYVPNAVIDHIDAATSPLTVYTSAGNFSGHVVNAIPPMRAGKVLSSNGLTDAAGGRWTAVDVRSYESVIAKNVHVIGDASFATPQPKAGHIGNQQGKTCADAIVRYFSGLPADENLVTNSACYSTVSMKEASWLTALYHYDPITKMMKLNGSVEEANTVSSDNFESMQIWFRTLMGESFR